MNKLPLWTTKGTIEAAKIEAVFAHPMSIAKMQLRMVDGTVLDVSRDYYDKFKPRPGGYFIQYPDNYLSFCPAESFEARHELLVASENRGETPCQPNADAAAVQGLHFQREVLDHRVEGKGGGSDDTAILVMDAPGQGGAHHVYRVISKKDGVILLEVRFQNGPIQECGVNGVQQEHLQAIIVDRLRSFQAGPFSSRENSIALTHQETALMWLQRRTVDRIRRGVEGYNKA